MVSRDNGDNGPSPNGFWLTKGKDDDGDDGDDDEQRGNGDNGGAQNQMGLATSERSDVGSQSFMAITIIPPTFSYVEFPWNGSPRPFVRTRQ